MANTADILRKLSGDEALARQMFEAMVNSEFQAEVAPNLGYSGPIDPSVARWHSLPTTRPTSLKGFQVPENARDTGSYSYGSGRNRIEVPQEPGTVNTVNVHATPVIWAHEYRHAQYPDLSERGNRIHDGYYAQDESDWKEAVGLWQDYIWNTTREKIPYEEAERKLIAEIEMSPANETRTFSAVSKEYRQQKSGEQSIIGDDQVTHGNPLLDVLSSKRNEFAAGRKRGQYWYKRKQQLSETSIEDAVDKGLQDADMDLKQFLEKEFNK